MDIATTLKAVMDRAVVSIVDGVASDGLVALKSVLDSSGFPKSEYLKNYDVLAHVSGTEIVFEILLDVEAVEPEDEEARKAMEEQAEQVEEKSSRTYRMTSRGVQRVQRDARRPARDARKTAVDRLFEHEVALHAPRSARITRSGKLAVTLKRSIRTVKEETVFPEGKFQGIIGKFMDEIKSVISDRFLPELSDIVRRHAT